MGAKPHRRPGATTDPLLSSSASPVRQSLTRATTLATAGMVVGYASTLVQQLVLSRSLGISTDVDALAAALAWAVSATGVVGWTIASLVVPLYIEARTRDPLEARRIARTASALAIVAGGVLAVITVLAADPLAMTLLPGSEPPSRDELASLLRISAPLHLVWTFWILTAALANARRHFAAATLVTVVPSVTIIAVIVVVPTVEAAAVAYVVGMAAQLAILIADGPEWRTDLVPALDRTALGRLGAGALPLALTFLFQNVALLVVRAAASLGGPGDVAAFDYALRLTLAGESVLLSGALAVALTVWSEDRATGAERLPLDQAIVSTAGVGLAVAAVVIALASPMVSLLFVGGRFGGEDAERVALALTWIAPGMAARMVLHLVMRRLLARRAAWLLAGVSSVAVTVIAFAGSAGQTAIGLGGVGFGYSLAWIVAAGVGVVGARRLR